MIFTPPRASDQPFLGKISELPRSLIKHQVIQADVPRAVNQNYWCKRPGVVRDHPEKEARQCHHLFLHSALGFLVAIVLLYSTVARVQRNDEGRVIGLRVH